METLTPTYKYLEDSVGSSNALQIASRYFDDHKLIENAKKYLQSNKTKEDELLDKLSKQIEENTLEKDKLLALEENFKKLSNDYENKISTFNKEKEKLKEKYLNDLNEYIDSIKDKASNKLEEIKQLQKEEEVINDFDELYEDKPTEEDILVEFNVGDNVRIKDNEQIGVITEIKNDQVTVSIRGLTVKTKKDDLTLMPKIEKKETKVISSSYKRLPSEINLVGERVEDALPVMEEYLDKANAAHMSSVKVIHGIGTGTLRTALRQRLKKLSYVKSFKDGDFYDGGSAVTMVEFKQ